MKWTISIKRTSTSCIYDSKLTCYNVVFIHNLVAKSHVCNARVPYSSLNGVCVCGVRVKHIVRSIIHGLDSEHLARAYMYYDLNST